MNMLGFEFFKRLRCVFHFVLPLLANGCQGNVFGGDASQQSNRIEHNLQIENEIMNLPPYEFCKENKALLKEFLKKSEECKLNKFCNLKEHEKLTKILPINETLKQLLIEEVIDITQSDDEEPNQKSQETAFTEIVHDTLKSSQEVENETTIDDIVCAIKENLESEKCHSITVITLLDKSCLNLTEIFTCLSYTLNYEEVLNFGVVIFAAPISNGLIVSHFVKHLFLKQLTQEFSDQFQSMYFDFCQKYSNILMEEIVNVIFNTKTEYSKVFLQYLAGSEVDFKTKLFRNFISKCNNLEEKHILLIDTLYNSSDGDSLNKLVELMSMSANDYTTSKPFGKLLLNVIKALGKNVHVVEKPMNHIISTHRSVWKGKIEKLYSDNLQESMSMSQSFRY